MLNQSNLIERGWSRAMIDHLLGRPDREQRNPRYSNASPMKLYDPERVFAVEGLPEFAHALERKEKRSMTARKAAWERTSKLKDRIAHQLDQIEIPKVTPRTLESGVKENKEAWASLTGQEMPNFENVSQSVWNRWCRNYIRHDLTEYDAFLAEIKGQPGVGELYEFIRDYFDQRIRAIYPDLWLID